MFAQSFSPVSVKLLASVLLQRFIAGPKTDVSGDHSVTDTYAALICSSPPAAGVLATGTPARTRDHAGGRKSSDDGRRRYKSFANCSVNRNKTIKCRFEAMERQEP